MGNIYSRHANSFRFRIVVNSGISPCIIIYILQLLNIPLNLILLIIPIYYNKTINRNEIWKNKENMSNSKIKFYSIITLWMGPVHKIVCFTEYLRWTFIGKLTQQITFSRPVCRKHGCVNLWIVHHFKTAVNFFLTFYCRFICTKWDHDLSTSLDIEFRCFSLYWSVLSLSIINT